MCEFTMTTASIGILAFLVSIITQVTKNTTFLNKIPTDLQVTITSIILTVFAYILYCQNSSITIQWYNLIGSFIGGFIVAFVAMFGWSKLTELFNKNIKK